MTEHAHALLRPSPLLMALERELDQHAFNPLSSSACPLVANHRWNAALGNALREFLSRPGKEFRGELTKLFFRMFNDHQAVPPNLPLVVEVLHAGSLVVDDVQDDSDTRRGRGSLHRLCGVPMAINVGNWLYFWAAELLADSNLSEPRRSFAQSLYNRSLLDCHYGQALDLSQRSSELAQNELQATVRATTELKSGSLLALSAALGALAGGANNECVLAAYQFGRDVGSALQMFDDLSGVLNVNKAHKGLEDLRNDRPTWVWAWLADSQTPEQFVRLRKMAASIACGGDPGLFLAELRVLLKGQKDAVKHWIDSAFERLQSALPAATNLTVLRCELQRLERSYV